MKADKLYLGNVITMDDYKPSAEAVCVKDGLIMYVGDEAIARSMCDENTEIIDVKGNSIYPGFLEAHCHPIGAGKMLDKEAVCDAYAGECLEDYIEIVRQFVEKHPGKKYYFAVGLLERDVKPHHKMIDAVIPDVPVIIGTGDGHSMWLNQKAMDMFEIDQKAVEFYGADRVRVDETGEVTGYISENPVFDIRKKLTTSIEDGVRALLVSQEFFFSKGYTGIYDAGLELVEKTGLNIYEAVTKDKRFKLRTYAGSLIDENCEDIPAAVEKIAEKMKKYNNEYFKIVGVKTFSDGVIEAHTGYLLEDYNDQPGYKGVARLVDHEKLVTLYTKAAENNMNVHVHTVGDAAIRANLDAMEEAAKITGKMDQRNALAHLQVVNKDDIKRFADLNVVAATAPLWTPKHPDYFPQEVAYVGEERAENAYPIKSFFDAGAAVVFHTDFPVSQNVSIPNSVFEAVKRRQPESTDEWARKSNEFITRYQAIEAMTKNVAYMWHEENRLGTLAVGKIANMTVYDKDFLKDELDEVSKAKLVYTIVDGDIVYRG